MGEVGSWLRRAVLRPLAFTIPRDCGGFALYFGTYTLLRTLIDAAPDPTRPVAAFAVCAAIVVVAGTLWALLLFPLGKPLEYGEFVDRD